MYALKLKFKGRIYLVVKEQMATERVVFFSQLQTHMAAHAGWKKKARGHFLSVNTATESLPVVALNLLN